MSQAFARVMAAADASPILRELRLQVETAAAKHRVALITGEPGAGKGAVARMIHDASPSREREYVEVHCVGGSTGALQSASGTVFLDEVGVLDAAGQHELIATLDANRARTLAATAQDLAVAVQERRFRDDLYYRLGVMPVVVPPVRAWERQDVARVAVALLDELSVRIAGAPRALAPEAAEAIVAHAWPGNLRELRNALERALISSRGRKSVGSAALAMEPRERPAAAPDTESARTLADVERAHIERTLREHGFNRSRAARALGISRMTLIKRIRDYGLEAPPS